MLSIVLSSTHGSNNWSILLLFIVCGWLQKELGPDFESLKPTWRKATPTQSYVVSHYVWFFFFCHCMLLILSFLVKRPCTKFNCLLWQVLVLLTRLWWWVYWIFKQSRSVSTEAWVQFVWSLIVFNAMHLLLHLTWIESQLLQLIL